MKKMNQQQIAHFFATNFKAYFKRYELGYYLSYAYTFGAFFAVCDYDTNSFKQFLAKHRSWNNFYNNYKGEWSCREGL